MDREAAVKRIKAIQKLYGFTPTSKEALDLAIEALQESQTTHDQMDACYMAQKKAVEKLRFVYGNTSTTRASHTDREEADKGGNDNE